MKDLRDLKDLTIHDVQPTNKLQRTHTGQTLRCNAVQSLQTSTGQNRCTEADCGFRLIVDHSLDHSSLGLMFENNRHARPLRTTTEGNRVCKPALPKPIFEPPIVKLIPLSSTLNPRPYAPISAPDTSYSKPNLLNHKP